MKLKQKIIWWLLKVLGYKTEFTHDWKPGYIRYFHILSYPKEGWINTFHNYDDLEQLKKDFMWIFAQNAWGPMLPKDSEQIVIDKTKLKLEKEEYEREKNQSN